VGQRARSEIEDIFKHVDVILTMSAPGPAPHGLASTGETNFNRLWTLLGVPCVNVPIYPHPGELPVGVQVIAPFRADRLAVEAAITLEMHMVDLRRLRTSWSQQKNRISAPARGWIE
jgi:Asp-tRNA(Asn)/Glu-tRNA(Gln) amidotransferase A subunit family amidase